MKIRAIAVAAGLGLALGGCNPEKPAEPEAPVAGPSIDPIMAAKFENALNFECEGGGKLDVVLGQGARRFGRAAGLGRAGLWEAGFRPCRRDDVDQRGQGGGDRGRDGGGQPDGDRERG